MSKEGLTSDENQAKFRTPTLLLVWHDNVMTEIRGGGKRKSFGINGLIPILAPKFDSASKQGRLE